MKKKLIALFLAAAMFLSWTVPSVPVFAAEKSVTGAWDGPTVAEAGDTVTLTWSAVGDEIEGIQGQISFDETQASLISASYKLDSTLWSLNDLSESNLALAIVDGTMDGTSSLTGKNAVVEIVLKLADALAVGTMVNVSFTGGKASDSSYSSLRFADTTQTIRILRYTAAIGESKYESLAAAVAAAQNGDTITMIDDEEITANAGVVIPVGKSITLDLNGKTVSQIAPDAKASSLIQNKGTLVIKDSSAEGTGILTAKALVPDTSYGYGNETVENYGTLTIESGTVENTSAGSGAYYAIDSREGAALTITGGKVSNPLGIAIRVASFGNAEAILNVSGGTVESGYFAVEYFGLASDNTANINISGGTFSTTDTDYAFDLYVAKNNGSFENVKVNITGGTFKNNVAFTAALPEENISITGGVFEGEYGPYSYDETFKFITGGIYKNYSYWSYFLEDGLAVEEISSGTYAGYFTVGAAKVRLDYVFKGKCYSEYFAYFEEAFEALNECAAEYDFSNLAIVLLDDVEVIGNAGVTVDAGVKVSLDLNGCTVTQTLTENKVAQLINNKGDLTITDFSDEGNGKLTNCANGTITGDWPAYNYATNLILNQGTLTVEKGMVENTCNSGISYAIDNNSNTADAILNVKGGTIKSGITAVRLFCNSTTNENTLNMTAGTIEGGYAAFWVQLPGASGQAKKATVNISGGNLKATDYAFYDYSYGDVFDNVSYSITDGVFDSTYGIYSYGLDGFIHGGYFREEESAEYLPEDYKFVEVTEGEFTGYYTVAEREYVAAISEKKYESLAEAVAEAIEGDVIKIIAADTYKLPNLPLNVTIKGAVDGVIIDATGNASIASVPNGASFENLTFNFGQSNYHGFQHAGTINMNECTLNGKFFSYSDMNFTDCVFNQNVADYAMWAYGGNLTYTDCEFNVKGKAVNVYNESGAVRFTITATGCEFNSDTTNKSAFNVKETCQTPSSVIKLLYDVVITDCTANGSWPTNKVGGSKLYMVDDQFADGTASGLTVTLDGKVVYPSYVAAIGEKVYFSLADAVAAAQSGDTIVLLEDCAGEGIFLPKGNKTVTIDLNGKTYTATSGVGSAGTQTQGFHLEDGNTVTIKNGTITSDGETVKMLIQNYANLTLDGVTLDGTNLPGSSRYVLSNNYGTTELKGGTVINAKEGDIAFDSYDMTPSYPSVPAVVITDAKINGNIEASGGKITINGGTVNGKINALEGYYEAGDVVIPGTSAAKFANDESQFCASPYATKKAEGAEWYTVVLNEFKVTFKLDGEVFKEIDVTVGEAIILPEAEEKPGYTFAGWQNAPAEMPAEDITIEGSYTAIEYTITYFDGDAEGNPCSYTVEDDDFTLIAPTKTEGSYTFTFDGWYDGETRITVIDTASMKNYTLTAKWYPDFITSDVYSVDQDQKFISKVDIKTLPDGALAKINERDHTMLNLQEDASYAGTGATADLMHGTQVYKTYTFIVTGDVNGDGEIDIADFVMIRAYILNKTDISGVYKIAANVNDDYDEETEEPMVDIADLVMIQAHILEKVTITAR